MSPCHSDRTGNVSKLINQKEKRDRDPEDFFFLLLINTIFYTPLSSHSNRDSILFQSTFFSVNFPFPLDKTPCRSFIFHQKKNKLNIHYLTTQLQFDIPSFANAQQRDSLCHSRLCRRKRRRDRIPCWRVHCCSRKG